MKIVCRPVNIDGINPIALRSWIDRDRTRKEAIKYQSLISLTKGVCVSGVYSVLGITRETLSEWRRRLINGGIQYLDRTSNRGRKSQLTDSLKRLNKTHVLKSPSTSGYRQKMCDGKLVCRSVIDKTGIEI